MYKRHPACINQSNNNIRSNLCDKPSGDSCDAFLVFVVDVGFALLSNSRVIRKNHSVGVVKRTVLISTHSGFASRSAWLPLKQIVAGVKLKTGGMLWRPMAGHGRHGLITWCEESHILIIRCHGVHMQHDQRKTRTCGVSRDNCAHTRIHQTCVWFVVVLALSKQTKQKH